MERQGAQLALDMLEFTLAEGRAHFEKILATKWRAAEDAGQSTPQGQSDPANDMPVGTTDAGSPALTATVDLDSNSPGGEHVRDVTLEALSSAAASDPTEQPGRRSGRSESEASDPSRSGVPSSTHVCES